MDTNNLSYFIECSRIKSARRKTRLQKKDKEKQLIQLDKKRDKLSRQKNDLPLIPLDIPYQKGWKRFFVLRDDVARSNDADFFIELLSKINTVQYSNNKAFTKRKKRRKKKFDIETIQELVFYDEWQWNDSKKCKLSEKERTFFTAINRWSSASKRFYTVFVFTEPWRYILKIKPHFITHYKMHDNVLEQQMAELENHIKNHHLNHKINKITNGRKNYYRCWDKNKLKYLNLLENKALHTILYECGQEIN